MLHTRRTAALTTASPLLDGFLSRWLHTGPRRLAKEQPNNLKGRSSSSQKWLTRQLADPFVEKAKMENYRFGTPFEPISHSNMLLTPHSLLSRCRSAFKLLEIDQKCKFLKPGQVILDCGAAPGSWTQIAVQKSNADGKMTGQPKGYVIGIDLLQIYPIPVRYRRH